MNEKLRRAFSDEEGMSGDEYIVQSGGEVTLPKSSHGNVVHVKNTSNSGPLTIYPPTNDCIYPPTGQNYTVKERVKKPVLPHNHTWYKQLTRSKYGR